jgi:M6 family metalloprotease-like protein
VIIHLPSARRFFILSRLSLFFIFFVLSCMSFSRRIAFVGLATLLAAGPVLARDDKGTTVAPSPSVTARCEQGPVFNSFSSLPDTSQTQEVFLKLQQLSAKLLSADRAKQKKETAGRQTDTIKQAIQGLGHERKTLMLEMMYLDPSLALRSAFLSSVQASLLPQLPSCVETSVSLEGTLSVVHVDLFEQRKEINEYILTTKAGERLRLHPAGAFSFPVRSNLPVSLEGFRLDNEVIFDAKAMKMDASNKGGLSLVPEAHADVPHAFGPQSSTAVLANFQNATTPLTVAQLNQNFFVNTNNYFQEVSYGKMSLVGQTLGTYTLPLNATCDYFAIVNAAIQAVDAQVNFSTYPRLMIVVPSAGCIWNGVGSVGKESLVTNDGEVEISWAIVLDNAADVRVLGHEFGHNIELQHASFLDCDAVSIAPNYNGCFASEYEDRYEIMGNINPMHLNAPHKDQLGWFDFGQVQEVTASGTYTLVPMTATTPGVKALKIRRGSNPSDNLWVEFRQPVGFDGPLVPTSDVYQGALLHTVLPDLHTLLVDASPVPTADSTTPSLRVGGSLTDPATVTTVQTTAVDANQLTVNVSLGKSDFTPPTVTITSPTAGATVASTITIEADVASPHPIEKVEFYIEGQLQTTDLEAPYAMDWNTTQVWNGTRTIEIKAYDLSGQPYGLPGNIGSSSISVTVLNEDLAPPTIQITSPTEGSTVSNPVAFTTQVTDDTGIYSVEFWEVGGSEAIVTDFTLPFTTSLFFAPHGPRAMYAVAEDFGGNVVASAPVTFDVQDLTPPDTYLIKPVNNMVLTPGTTYKLEANAFDNEGVITKVEFYLDNALLATTTSRPYHYNWNIPALPSGSLHPIYAKAYDPAGNIGVSSVATIKIKDSVPPVGSITSPTNNTQVTGMVPITVNATDDVWVSKVDFYRNGVFLGTDYYAPYVYNWTTYTYTLNTSHGLAAKIYDSSGNVTNTATTTVQIVDTVAPTTAITSPTNGSTVPRGTTVTLSASASDYYYWISKVEFYVNGSRKCTDTTAPYTCDWAVPTKAASYTLTSKAFDPSGNIGTSPAVNVTSQ